MAVKYPPAGGFNFGLADFIWMRDEIIDPYLEGAWILDIREDLGKPLCVIMGLQVRELSSVRSYLSVFVPPPPEGGPFRQSR